MNTIMIIQDLLRNTNIRAEVHFHRQHKLFIIHFFKQLFSGNTAIINNDIDIRTVSNHVSTFCVTSQVNVITLDLNCQELLVVFEFF